MGIGCCTVAALTCLFLASMSNEERAKFEKDGKSCKAVITQALGTRSSKDSTYYVYMLQYEAGATKHEFLTQRTLGDTINVIYIPGTTKVYVDENHEVGAFLFFVFFLLAAVLQLRALMKKKTNASAAEPRIDDKESKDNATLNN